jgi:hypothetical protein
MYSNCTLTRPALSYAKKPHPKVGILACTVEPVRFERTSIAVPPCGFRRDVEPVTAPGLGLVLASGYSGPTLQYRDDLTSVGVRWNAHASVLTAPSQDGR